MAQARVSVRARVKVGDLGGHQENIRTEGSVDT